MARRRQAVVERDVEPMMEERSERRSRLAAFAAVAEKSSAFRPAREVLRRVRAVRTVFPQYDHATRVGGHPIERIATIHGPSNHGKAQPIDEPVLTPTGWRSIGDLRVGDLVIGSDGGAKKVVGVFPQGRKRVLRLTMDDGAWTRCCEEHLWFTTTGRELNRGRYTRAPRPDRVRTPTGIEGGGSVKTAKAIATSLADDVHYLPIVHPVGDFFPEPLAFDPYILGLLLGDGCLTGSSPTYCSADLELIHAVEDYATSVGDLISPVSADGDDLMTIRIVGGPRGISQGSSVMHRLRGIDVFGKSSEAKHVPREFLFANAMERLALLQGLMDTDGSVSNEGTQAQFSTTSPALRDAVVDLARSLGGRAMTYSKETGALPAWCVMVSFPIGGVVPFRLSRKVRAWVGRTKELRRRIEKVDADGDSECVCIALDAEDHLYVTRGYILTHNTIFTLGLGKSFLLGDHFFKLIDAERTTPMTWIEEMFGPELARHPGFVASRPDTYESAVAEVREFAKRIGEAKEAKKLPPNTTGLIVVDSIRKLVPKGFFDKIAAETRGKGDKKTGVDGYGGRGAQIKAAMNAAWLDELVPLLEQAGLALAFITRETDDPDADVWDKRTGEDFKVGGGKSLVYDASLLIRVERASFIKQGVSKDADADERKSAPVYGERHRITIRKTKIAGKQEKYVTSYFHTSNGVLTPVGFDLARDVLELGERVGVLQKSGGWIAWRKKKWNGLDSAVKKLTAEPELLAELEAAVREKFDTVNPEEHDADGVT